MPKPDLPDTYIWLCNDYNDGAKMSTILADMFSDTGD
jgi:hypothetical protein